MHYTFVKALSIFLLISLATLPTLASLPPQALQFLETLPEKSVTLEYVLTTALSYSDSFKALKASQAAIDAPLYQSAAALDPHLFLRATHLEDSREPSSIFFPNRSIQTTYALGINTYFPTGTGLTAELSHGYKNYLFQTIPGSAYYDTFASFQIYQNLWRDGLGASTRKELNRGRVLTDLRMLTYDTDVEEYLLNLIQIFYRAWLAQSEALASNDHLQRRIQLNDVTDLKRRRGTAEEKDYLQVNAALLDAKARKDRAEENLNSIWRELIMMLKLPAAILQLDPKEIPISLDSPFQEAMEVCQLDRLPYPTHEVRKMTLQNEVSTLARERAEDALSPALVLKAGLMTNGLDGKRGLSFDETFRGDHPAWSLGIELMLPIFRFSEKALLKTALSDELRTNALLKLSQDRAQLDHLTMCSEMKRAERAVEQFDLAAKSQQKRFEIEQKNFLIGQTSTLAIVQAGDDATSAGVNLRNAEIERRLVAWKIRRLLGLKEVYLNKNRKLNSLVSLNPNEATH